MSLGLGASLNTVRKATLPGIVTSGLVLKQNYDTGAIVPISDGAASFNGSSEYITIGDNADMGTGDVSVACWFFPKTDTQHGATLVGKQENYNVNALGYGLYYRHSTATVWWNIGDSSSGARVNEAIADIGSSEYQWIHAVGTYIQSTGVIKLYLNGVEVATATQSGLGTLNNALDLKLGYGNVYYNGYIANTGIWSEALTQPQIKSIMYKNYAGLTTSETDNLVSWWNLDKTADDGDALNAVIDNTDETLGSELHTSFTNVDFNTHTVNGTGFTAAETDGAANDNNYSTISCTAGKVYRVYYNATYNSGSENIKIEANDGSTELGTSGAVYTNLITEGGAIFYFIADNTTMYLGFRVSGAAVTNFTVADSFSVKEVNGNIGVLK